MTTYSADYTAPLTEFERRAGVIDPAETVKLHVIIDIQVDDPDADTGITVGAWNAMTPKQRDAVVHDVWNASAVDGGGIRVVTTGAEQI